LQGRNVDLHQSVKGRKKLNYTSSKVFFFKFKCSICFIERSNEIGYLSSPIKKGSEFGVLAGFPYVEASNQ